MKVKAANGLARILKAEGAPWVSCYPTNHVNNALGEEGVPIRIAAGLKPVTKRIGKIDKASLSTPATIEES